MYQVLGKQVPVPVPSSHRGCTYGIWYLSLSLLKNVIFHWRRQLWGTGARASLDFQLFNFFQVTSEPQKLWHSTPSGFLCNKKSIQTYSFVTVYCTNFIIFLCVFLKLFSLSFMPPAPNSGNATVPLGVCLQDDSIVIAYLLYLNLL